MSVGTQRPGNVANDFATLSYIVQQALSRISTLSLCRVISCTNEGGIVPVGTLTVQVLVDLMGGDRTAVRHLPIYDVPYCRVQGGRNAIIIDPKPGDLGLVGFCERDISAVKAAKNFAPPGSYEQFSKSAGVYIATCLGTETPEQYVAMNDERIAIVSPTEVLIQSPLVRILGELQQSNGDASFAQAVNVGDQLTAQNEVTAGNIGLTTHKHPTAPVGPVSPPIP